MKITMAASVSLDGFIAQHGSQNVMSWTSQEDKEHLKKLLKRHKLHVLGSRTYDTYKPVANPDILRVILTHEPSRYQHDVVSNQIEFHTLTATMFVKKFSATYESCLVLGGSDVYTAFLLADLIDEIYLTVEPIHLRSGTRLLSDKKSLDDFTNGMNKTAVQLNTNGTSLLHYKR